ncbi:MAG: aminotransferase class IV family protein [Paracoccaceae bacterium]|nr:aminotransferase class IV family protein [Paracoccaceae bacterium]
MSPEFGAHPLPPGFEVIETFCWDGARFVRLAQHVARLERSCRALDISFDPMHLYVRLDALPDGGALRVRVGVAADGQVRVTHGPLVPAAPLWRVGLSADLLRSDDPWLTIKTTQRALYDRTRAALPEGMDEMLFCNENAQICEGTITSVFFDRGQGLCTPPLTCGVLPGVLRADLLQRGACQESVLPQAELADVRLWVGNSLRGLIAAKLVCLD